MDEGCFKKWLKWFFRLKERHLAKGKAFGERKEADEQNANERVLFVVGSREKAVRNKSWRSPWPKSKGRKSEK